KELSYEIQRAISGVVRDNDLIMGQALYNFEHNFAKYCGASYAIGCGNGLDAITLALKALDVGSGDEVVVPANSFIATALAVEACGAKSIFVDCNPNTYSIDIEQIEAKITDKTKAIIPVHLYGIVADMDMILEIARRNKLYVIEDAAQAHGAEYKGKRVGSIGDITTFSFYPTKNMGGLGDGGCIVTNNEDIAKKVRVLSNYGSEKKYHHIVKGVNSRLDSIQAAVLDLKIAYIDKWNARRRDLADIYFSRLSQISEVNLPEITKGSKAIWHVFPIRLPSKDVRDRLVDHLNEYKIGTNIHYPIPIHCSGAYAEGNGIVSAPVSEDYAGRLISLPLDPYHSEDEINYVCEAIEKFKF
ncbi:MAG: DegT/DnrJ/EryC1/StrS family aminotransferase, partial [Gammaproteobacteria bacterium]|nr:DegT/DnrJ/EryC1/StrS family aminotransferase [Gammaproteobacteria bacterium]